MQIIYFNKVIDETLVWTVVIYMKECFKWICFKDLLLPPKSRAPVWRANVRACNNGSGYQSKHHLQFFSVI